MGSTTSFGLAATLLLALGTLASAQQGIVKDWFTVLKGYVATTPGMGHQQAARLFAGLALSMDQALKCARQQQGDLGGATQDAAAAFGAHCYLNLAFPTQYLAHDLRLAQQLANATDALKAAGRACGEAGAVKVFSSRVSDGMAKYAQLKLPKPTDGVYRFTPGMAALTLPGLGDVAPYLLSAKQCARITDDYVARLHGTGRHATQGPYYGSQRYLDDLAEVSRLGCNASSVRTAEQALTASFWNDGAGTSTAIGHFYSIALQVIPPHFSASQQVRFFAVLFTALSDVSIPCFKVKYTTFLWRPWTAISSPSAPPAVRDPTWVPALAQPGHPSYPSGHSCLSGAATKVHAWAKEALELLTGSDATRVAVVSEGVPGAPERVFTRFSDIAREAGRSRVYGGLHFANDCDAGMALGQEVALAAWSKLGGWCGAK